MWSTGGATMQARILCLPGPGVGPELLDQARRVLAAVASAHGHRFDLVPPPDPVAASLDSDEAAAVCQVCDALLLGATPAPDDPLAPALRALCRRLHLHSLLQSADVALAPGTPRTAAPPASVLLVRDLAALDDTPAPGPRPVPAADLAPVVRLALRAANRQDGHLLAVDPATGPGCPTRAAWRQLLDDLVAAYRDVAVQRLAATAVAPALHGRPGRHVVLACGPGRGALQEDLARLAGSPGLMPAAAVGEGSLGLFAPAHGPVTRLAGRDRANPVGALLAVVLLLRHALELTAEADRLQAAIVATLRDGPVTADLATDPRDRVGTRALVDRVLARLRGDAAEASG
jgi:3-isopropylmalate dehydrogenase